MNNLINKLHNITKPKYITQSMNNKINLIMIAASIITLPLLAKGPIITLIAFLAICTILLILDKYLH